MSFENLWHFATFEFGPTAVAQADNYDLFTVKLGATPSAWKDQIFRDIHVNSNGADGFYY
jgi:hypothetical protein